MPRLGTAYYDIMGDDDEDVAPFALTSAAFDLGLMQRKKVKQTDPSAMPTPPQPKPRGRPREGLGGRPVNSGDPIMFGTLINRGRPYESGLYYS